jgi:hypothetical protein
MMVASKTYGAWLKSRVGGILCIAVVDGGKLYSIECVLLEDVGLEEHL